MDNYDEDPIDQTLRRVAGNPSPSAGDRERAWQAYTRATATVNQKPSRRRPMFAAVATVTAVALVVGFVAVAALRPSPAQAALLEIAEAAERLDPLTIPQGQYAYTQSETINLGVTGIDPFPHRATPIAYLIPTDRQIWNSEDGTTSIVTTIGQPTFFNATDEVDYFAAGYDAIDQVGQTVTETFGNTTSILTERDWPTDPKELRDVIIELIPEDSQRPMDVEILDVVLDLIREVGPTPALRAAAIAVIADLDPTVEDESPGQTTFSIVSTQPDNLTIRFTLTDEGHLISETTTDIAGNPRLGIPPGTQVASSIYEPTIITTSLPTD